MAHRLQVGLNINTDADAEYEIQVTPVDIEIPEGAAKLLKQGIGLIDLADAEPGDGELDVPAKFKVPTRLRIFGKNIEFTVDAMIELRVEDR